MFSVKLKIDNKPWQRMQRNLLRGSNKVVDVGWWQTIHPSGDSVAQIAQWNEEGHINGGSFAGTWTPARPFVRNMFMERAKQVIDAKYVPTVFDRIAQGEATWTSVRTEMQQDLKEAMQSSILDWDTPPNSPVTVSIKGFNDPLISTGTTYDSVKTRLVTYSRGGTGE